MCGNVDKSSEVETENNGLLEFRNLILKFLSDEGLFGYDAPTTQNALLEIRDYVKDEGLLPLFAKHEYMRSCGATHIDPHGEYWGVDTIGRWCCLDASGDAYPVSIEQDYVDKLLKI